MVERIYLDTNLWNRLVDRHVDPMRLLENLRVRGATLALSQQSIYELSKTFPSNRNRLVTAA